MNLSEIEPHIRFVNNFGASYAHVQRERVIYDFEFMYVVSGRICIYYGEKRYDLKKSDMFYFEPGVKNHMETYEGAGLKTHCVHFDWYRGTEDFRAEDVYFDNILTPELTALRERLLRRENPRPSDLRLPNFMPGLSYETFAPGFRRLYYAFIDKSPSSELKRRALFLNIISELAAGFCVGEKPIAMHPQIVRAIEYIKENYHKKITVENMAFRLNLSPKYFGTLFERTTGKTMRAFINDIRIAESKRMLSGTAMSIEEIAERIGYANAFYFSNCFKSREGCSPTKYRQMT